MAGECSFGMWAPLHDDQGWPKCRMIRSRRYKYIVYAPAEPPCEQLFDMENDPNETTNLAADPGCAEILERHRAWLQQWCEETNDIRKRWHAAKNEGKRKKEPCRANIT